MVFKTDEAFDLHFEMSVYLKPFEYKLVYTIDNSTEETQLLTGYYNQLFSENRLESIVVKLVNNVLQRIDKKVAE